MFSDFVDTAQPYHRNTIRVNECLWELAFRTNYVQAAKLSKKLSLSVNHDKLLRLIYQIAMPTQTSPLPHE